MQNDPPKFKIIFSMPFGENTYVAHFNDRKDCIVVDPGLEPDKITAYLDKIGKTPAIILCTHGHSDHIAGNAALKERWPEAPLVIGVLDAEKLTDPVLNLSAQFGASILSPEADRTVKEGDIIEAAGFTLEVLDTPGHCQGHVVFLWRGPESIYVFGGDVLFQNSIGRTDFPDGSFEALERSIRTKLYTLPDDTRILPGHGATTTVGEEKATNPFVSGE